MNRQYIPRLFDQILEFSLKSKGAVVIVGPNLNKYLKDENTESLSYEKAENVLEYLSA